MGAAVGFGRAISDPIGFWMGCGGFDPVYTEDTGPVCMCMRRGFAESVQLIDLKTFV